MQGPPVQSLVGELRSHRAWSLTKRKKRFYWMDVYKMEALKVLGSKKKQVDLGGKSMYGERSDRK